MEYFGKVAYPYGNTEHVPKVYPDTPIFKKISSAITQHDPNFSLDKYTCLVTRYQNGEAFIPAHSDDEHCIVPDSNIYTVSIGAKRTLVCHKTMGPLSEREYELTDGSVHVMSAASQLCWQHGIPPRKSCNDARVSFTFRLLDGNAKPPPKKHIPPIRENAPLDQPGRKKKVLFLSDSVNRGLNTHLFRGTGLVCIKRPNLFQLSQLDKYECEFEHCDYVVISAGINDLSRYGHTSESLSRLLCDKLRYFMCKYPDTVFIFNSVLRTNYDWLNRQVDRFNRSIFDFSLEVYPKNLYFLDTHCRLIKSPSCTLGLGVISPGGNGIHITKQAGSVVQNCLVECLVSLDRDDGTVAGVWALRYGYLRSASAFHASRRQSMRQRRCW